MTLKREAEQTVAEFKEERQHKAEAESAKIIGNAEIVVKQTIKEAEERGKKLSEETRQKEEARIIGRANQEAERITTKARQAAEQDAGKLIAESKKEAQQVAKQLTETAKSEAEQSAKHISQRERELDKEIKEVEDKAQRQVGKIISEATQEGKRQGEEVVAEVIAEAVTKLQAMYDSNKLRPQQTEPSKDSTEDRN
jgi:vacuolar-type H+-ATPase subunit H